MYTVHYKGSNRVLSHKRRDITQNLDNLEQVRELSRKGSLSDDSLAMSSPRPTFQPSSSKQHRSNGRASQEVISPQHEELIRFFSEAWVRVSKEIETGRQNGTVDQRGNVITYYQHTGEHPSLRDFRPFDLENWWGNKMYENITQST